MKYNILHIIPIILILTLSSRLSKGSEPGVWSDEIFDTRIKTVQLFRQEWNLSYPFLKIRSNDKLVLGFDLLDKEPESYYYTFIHCDKDWKESSIYPSDYLDGLPEEQVENYKPSFNTTVHYYHYQLIFPNERINFRLSGNYIIKIYKPGESMLL
jgi:hypothetical protein